LTIWGCAAVFEAGGGLYGEGQSLLEAIRENDSGRVRTLLRDGADPNATDEEQDSALMFAALYAEAPVLNLLIASGARLDARNQTGLTALFWASHSYDNSKILIDAGADVGTKSALGGTPLFGAAALPGNAKLVRLLLDHGANPNVTVGGATSLTMAAWTGDAEEVAVLLNRGADPKAAGFGGISALHAAVSRGERAMVDLLLRSGANVEARTSQDEDVLERYGFWNDPALVSLLLQKGIDPGRKDRRGHNALLFAASSDTVTPEVFQLLLRHGTPGDARNAYGDDALAAAQRRADPRIVPLLGGSVVAPQEQKGQTIVMEPRAIRSAIVRALELLEKSGPSVAKERGCFSCHHQGLPSMAASCARKAGIEGNAIAETNRQLVYPILNRSRALLLHGVAPAGEAATVAWELIGLQCDGQKQDLLTDIAVNYVAAAQMPAGNWQDRWNRPPLEYSGITATAVAIRALQEYPLPGRRAEFERRIARAADWLARTSPGTSEEAAMRLLGLVWGRAPATAISRAARALAAQQRASGGWGQLASLAADGYATGQALVALHEAGYARNTSPIFRQGVKYLLGTQQEDGSWHVRSRALPVQPLFESGFPHGRDQWISAAGTSWAVMALSTALPAPSKNR
jgi:ankyrin repeat protein